MNRRSSIGVNFSSIGLNSRMWSVAVAIWTDGQVRTSATFFDGARANQQML